MEKNNIEILNEKTIETTDEELSIFLDVLAKNGKLETFFKALDILIDDTISDDIELNIDDLKNQIEKLESKEQN